MTNFDTPPRAMAGEDAQERIREFVEGDTGPWTPIRSMASGYLANGAGYGPLEDRLTLAVLCDALQEIDARLRRLESREAGFSGPARAGTR